MIVPESIAPTERLVAEIAKEKVLDNNTVFETFAQASQSGLLALDEHGYPMFINAAAAKMIGSTLEEIQERPLQSWICYLAQNCSTAPHLCPLTCSLKTLQPVQNQEVWFVRKSGSLFPVRCSVTPIAHNKQLRGAVVEFQDISSEHKAREALRDLQVRASREAQNLQMRTASLKEAADQLETFCYTVAHDLRAPLRAQLGYANLILEDYGLSLDENAQHYLQKIIASARYQDRLTSDLLAYARVSRQELEFEAVDLGKIVDDAVATFNEQIVETGACVQKRGAFPPVMGHGLTLRLALENLISNALKYVGAGVTPRITLRATEDETSVRLWVEDNGIGIAPEHREQIFQIFQRLHSQDKFSGTGIGLALVRKAVSRMNGTVGLESECGKGTRFWMELPKALTPSAV